MLSSSLRQHEKRFLKGVAENPGLGSGSFYDQMSVVCLSISQRAGFYERVIIGVIYWAPTACKALYIYYLCALRDRASLTIALIPILSPRLCVANGLMPVFSIRSSPPRWWDSIDFCSPLLPQDLYRPWRDWAQNKHFREERSKSDTEGYGSRAKKWGKRNGWWFVGRVQNETEARPHPFQHPCHL